MSKIEGCALALLTFQCVAHVQLPEQDVDIACAGDADCPGGRICQQTSARCELTSTVDNEAPALNGVAPLHHEAIRVSFSEPMDMAELARVQAYSLLPPLEVRSVFVEDAQSVILTVASQTTGVSYVLHVTAMHDRIGNAIAPPGDAFAFTGLGPTADPLPPDPLQPEAGAVVYGSTAVLAWAVRPLATRYEVSVARDAAFTDFLSASPYSTSATTLALSGLEARTYYWRVRADTSGEAAYGTSSFDIVRDRVRVYCGETCAAGGGVGNISKPLTQIGRAILLAAAHGISRVDVAARPGGLAYLESFSLVAGVDVYGGYGPDFDDATRDPINARARVQGSGADTVSAVEIRGVPTHIEGLELQGAATDTSRALFVFHCDALSVRHCTIRGASGSGTLSVGVSVDRTDPPHPLIEDCAIFGGDGYERVIALQSVFGSPALLRNRILGGRPARDGDSYGVRRVDAEDHGAVQWSNNIIGGGAVTGIGTSFGALVTANYGLTHNVIFGGTAEAAGRSIAVRTNQVGPNRARLSNNVLFTLSPAFGICLERSTVFGGALQNNVFADCANAAARKVASAGTCPSDSLHDSCVAPSGAINTAATMGAGLASGNIDGGAANAVFMAPPDDLHLSAASPAKDAGLDASLAICGLDGATSCGDVSTDFDGAARTVPYSSGAYERD